MKQTSRFSIKTHQQFKSNQRVGGGGGGGEGVIKISLEFLIQIERLSLI